MHDDLIARCRQGDRDAYYRLYKLYSRSMYSISFRITGREEDAEDALQEAMLRAWRGLSRFEGRSSLRTWLYTITTNACLTAIARRPQRVLPIDYGPAADPHGDLGGLVPAHHHAGQHVPSPRRPSPPGRIGRVVADTDMAMPSSLASSIRAIVDLPAPLGLDRT